MAHKFINQIEPGEAIDDIYVVRDPILRSTARGDLYIVMFLSDRTGQLNGRMWQATETVYKALPKPGFVHIQGRSELYQNNLQIIINNVSVVDADKVRIDDYLAKTDKDIDKMFEEVKRGPLAGLASHYGGEPPPKGEVSIVVAPFSRPGVDDAELDRRLTEAMKSGTLRDAADGVSAATGVPRRRVYARALGIKQGTG